MPAVPAVQAMAHELGHNLFMGHSGAAGGSE
jgi:hypothetical protein